MKTIRLISRRAAALFLFVCLLNVAGTAQAADANPPERLTYQGYLVDGNGVALATNAPKNFDVVFRIYDSQTGGVLKWSEQQTVTVDKGYFSVLLGEGSQVGSEPHAALSTIFNVTDSSDRFVGLTVKGIGAAGADVDILPRLRMLTAPYAYLAKKAVNASSLVNITNNQIVTVVGLNVGVNKPTPNTALDVAGTVTATAFAGNGASLTALSAGNVTAGTLDAARVPNLDAGKITTGTLNADRVPGLDAAKITAGTLNNSRLASTVARTDIQQTFSGRPIFNGAATLNVQPLYIRGDGDVNHILRYAGSFGGYTIDGPLLSGYQGGILGSTQNGALANVIWNGTGVTITGQAASSANASTAQSLAQHLTIQARDIQGSGVRLTLGMSHVNNTEYAGVIQAYGGNGAAYTTLRLNPLGGSVAQNSDRNAKTAFTPIDAKTILDKVSELPMSKWSYKGEEGVFHIGPMAQDFKAAFGLGSDDRSIGLADGPGVAIAAIQGLNEVVKEKDEEIQALKREVRQLRDLKKEMEDLRALVDALAKKQSADGQ